MPETGHGKTRIKRMERMRHDLRDGSKPERKFEETDIKSTHINFAVTFGRNEELKEIKRKKVMLFPLIEALYNPRQSGWLFHGKADGDSKVIRMRIPKQSG